MVETKEERILRETASRLKIQDYKAQALATKEEKGKLKAQAMLMREKRAGKLRKKQGIKSREKAVRGTLTAMGIIAGKQQYAGAGRPRGTYKYGMPIHIYKQKLREDRARFAEFQQQQQMKFSSQGFTPEQVQQIQQQQTMEELQQPSVPQAVQQLQQRQQRIQMLQQAQQGIMPQQLQQQQYRYAQDMPFRNPSDEQLQFMKWKAERTIHPNTQRLMQEVRRIQLLGKTANIEQGRRNRERRMLANQMDLLKAHENMTDVRVDFTGVPEDNILFAPSVFKNNPENNILKPRGLSLLNTREGGNDLNFW